LSPKQFLLISIIMNYFFGELQISYLRRLLLNRQWVCWCCRSWDKMKVRIKNSQKLHFNNCQKNSFIVLLIRSVKANMQDHTISVYLLSEGFSSLRCWITLIVKLHNHINVLLYLHFKDKQTRRIVLMT